MSYHLHWLPGVPTRGKVGRYVHDHSEPAQSHFYAGDRPVYLKLMGSYPSGSRLLPDGRRNTKTHLRFPDGFGGDEYYILLLCGAKPLNISMSRNGPVDCVNCVRQIKPMDTLWEDVKAYRESVDIEAIERAVTSLQARESLRSLDQVRNQLIETALNGPSSVSSTTATANFQSRRFPPNGF